MACISRMSVIQEGATPSLIGPSSLNTQRSVTFCGHLSTNMPVETSAATSSIRSDPLPGLAPPATLSVNLIPSQTSPLAKTSECSTGVRFGALPAADQLSSHRMTRSASVYEMHHASNPIQEKPVMTYRSVITAEIPRTKTPSMEFQPPEPLYIEEGGEKYGMRCICGRKENGSVLVMCDKCGFWLHGLCVGVARARDEPFYCPFCLGRAIKCKCGEDMRYDVPIVQCANCKFWVHKACENIGWGILPRVFTCSRCRGSNFILPHVRPEFRALNRVSFVNCDRYEVVRKVPEGQFRNFVLADLNKTELNLYDTMSRYFHSFAAPLFERNHEFWKLFMEVMVALLGSTKKEILETLDIFARTLLYAPFTKKVWPDEVTFGMSENAMALIDPDQVREVRGEEKHCYRTADWCLHVKESLDDDQFILDLPGFLMTTDEVNADNGISLQCIRIIGTDFVVDMEGTKFEFAPYLKRSFHYNCYAKLYKRDGNVRVGLFSTRMKGPVAEHKRGPVILPDGVLSIPLDGDIPYPLPKCEWKTARQKYNATKTRARNQTKNNQKLETTVQLSLLSGFCEDVVPPLPFSLISDRESQSRNHVSAMVRDRTRKKHRGSDDE